MLFFNKGLKAKELHDFDNSKIKNIIDIRSSSDFKNSNIRGSRNVQFNKLISMPQNYIKDNNHYYIICYSGVTSRRACSLLKKQGITNVTSVKGGYGGYERTKNN